MKIRSMKANNRRKAFEVMTAGKRLVFPFAQLPEVRPTADDPIANVYVDRELGAEGFTYALKSGQEGTVHVEDVLEYNQDPDHLRDLLLYRLTLDAQKRIAASPLAKREIIRRLGTSPTQLYRLLDQTNYRKSVDQLLRLLQVLDCDVRLVVRAKSAEVAEHHVPRASPFPQRTVVAPEANQALRGVPEAPDFMWWAVKDSNLGPADYQALSGLLSPATLRLTPSRSVFATCVSCTADPRVAMFPGGKQSETAPPPRSSRPPAPARSRSPVIAPFDDPILANSALDRFAHSAHQIVMEGPSLRAARAPGPQDGAPVLEAPS